MRYAETGYNLEVDLSRGSIDKVETDPRLTEQHLGGQGTAAKILWDRVPPEADPFSEEAFLHLLELAKKGIGELTTAQTMALAD